MLMVYTDTDTDNERGYAAGASTTVFLLPLWEEQPAHNLIMAYNIEGIIQILDIKFKSGRVQSKQYYSTSKQLLLVAKRGFSSQNVISLDARFSIYIITKQKYVEISTLSSGC